MKKINNLINYLNNNGFEKEAAYLRKEAGLFGLFVFLFGSGSGCSKVEVGSSDEEKVVCKKDSELISLKVNPGDTFYAIFMNLYGDEVSDNESLTDELVSYIKEQNDNLNPDMLKNTVFEEEMEIMIPNPEMVEANIDELAEKLGLKKDAVKKVIKKSNSFDSIIEVARTMLSENQSVTDIQDDYNTEPKTLSSSGKSFLMGWEGSRKNNLNPYLSFFDDKRGANKKDTIGYGHKLDSEEVEENKKLDLTQEVFINGKIYKLTDGELTKSEAIEIFETDVKERENYLNKKFAIIPLSQNEFDALLSLVFQAGYGNFHRFGIHKLFGNRMRSWDRTAGKIKDGKKGVWEKDSDYIWSLVKKKSETHAGNETRRDQERRIARNGVYDSSH